HHHRLLEGASQPHRVPLVALLSHGELSELADRALRGSDRAATGRAGRAEAAVDDALPRGAIDGPHLQLVFARLGPQRPPILRQAILVGDRRPGEDVAAPLGDHEVDQASGERPPPAVLEAHHDRLGQLRPGGRPLLVAGDDGEANLTGGRRLRREIVPAGGARSHQQYHTEDSKECAHGGSPVCDSCSQSIPVQRGNGRQRHRGTASLCGLAVGSYPLSVIRYPISVVSYPRSVISYQSGLVVWAPASTPANGAL